MNINDYILTKKANGDSRTVAEIRAEFKQLMTDLQPKQDPNAIVFENIAPQLDVAEQERADGKKRKGTFDDKGNVVWGQWL